MVGRASLKVVLCNTMPIPQMNDICCELTLRFEVGSDVNDAANTGSPITSTTCPIITITGMTTRAYDDEYSRPNHHYTNNITAPETCKDLLKITKQRHLTAATKDCMLQFLKVASQAETGSTRKCVEEDQQTEGHRVECAGASKPPGPKMRFDQDSKCHEVQMTWRTPMAFQERCVKASGLATVQDLYIGDSVLPADSKDGAKGAHVKLLHFLCAYSTMSIPHTRREAKRTCLCPLAIIVLIHALSKLQQDPPAGGIRLCPEITPRLRYIEKDQRVRLVGLNIVRWKFEDGY
ncbi:hypothetical protein LSAT2_008617 [Lamellibrachia satsuma]|nr:hypothetical protein LSAT2_008617 [Lamellibrachia satsuma]